MYRGFLQDQLLNHQQTYDDHRVMRQHLVSHLRPHRLISCNLHNTALRQPSAHWYLKQQEYGNDPS